MADETDAKKLKAETIRKAAKHQNGHGFSRGADRDPDRADSPPDRASEDGAEGLFDAPRTAQDGRATVLAAALPRAHRRLRLPGPHRASRHSTIGGFFGRTRGEARHRGQDPHDRDGALRAPGRRFRDGAVRRHDGALRCLERHPPRRHRLLPADDRLPREDVRRRQDPRRLPEARERSEPQGDPDLPHDRPADPPAVARGLHRGGPGPDVRHLLRPGERARRPVDHLGERRALADPAAVPGPRRRRAHRDEGRRVRRLPRPEDDGREPARPRRRGHQDRRDDGRVGRQRALRGGDARGDLLRPRDHPAHLRGDRGAAPEGRLEARRRRRQARRTRRRSRPSRRATPRRCKTALHQREKLGRQAATKEVGKAIKTALVDKRQQGPGRGQVHRRPTSRARSTRSSAS